MSLARRFAELDPNGVEEILVGDFETELAQTIRPVSRR